MPDSRSPHGPVAGGAILALSLLVSVVAGVALRQPSLGLLCGLAIGSAICLAIWLRDRRFDR